MVGTIGNKAFNATDINAQSRLGVFFALAGGNLPPRPRAIFLAFPLPPGPLTRRLHPGPGDISFDILPN